MLNSNCNILCQRPQDEIDVTFLTNNCKFSRKVQVVSLKLFNNENNMQYL